MPRAKRTSTAESKPRRSRAASLAAETAAVPAAVNLAESYGIRVIPAQVTAGQNYWRVISVRHLPPEENRGRHNVYVDAKDESGQRCRDAALRIGWTWQDRQPGQVIQPIALDKPDNEPAGNVDVYSGQHIEIWIQGDGLPSGHVANMHTNHPDEPGPGGELWNSVGHHSFHVVFQRTRQESDGGGVKPPAPFRFEVWPTEFRTVTQAFGANPQNYQRFGLPGHEGLDIQASPGSKVFCVAPGQVKMVHLNPDPKVHAYGIHVRVSHADNYETIYAHLQSAVVQPGQQVVAGQLLGLADNTGNSLGDHLHITLKHHGESSGGYPGSIVDPTPFLVPLLTETTGRARDMGPVRVAEKLGLNCNAPTDPNGGITPRVADPRLIADTGVRWVRVNFILHPAKTPTDPAWVDTYRRIVRGLRDQGLKIYGLVGVEAAGSDPGNEFREEPANSIESDWIRQYAANFRLIVQQFCDDVEVFESFNEPNNWHHVDKEWKKAWIHPAWFAVMLQRVYEAVRDLDVTLVSGPLLSTPHGNNAADYLPKVYDAGKRRFGWGNPGVPVPFHGVGFHPYVLGDSAAPRDEIPARYEEYMAAFRRVITTKESGLLRPIYLSELGFQNAEDRQVECMKVGLDCALKDPSVALCFWYGMQDDVEKYGLYRIDGLSPQHRKPVYEPFVSLARDPRKVPIAAMRPVSPINAARYVGEFDQVPDGTVLPPGRAFSKTWRLANTGTTTWGDGYRFLRVGGPSLGALASVRAPVCAPGGSADLTVAFAAPPDAGEYTSFWQLADPAGNPFSPKVWAQIRVQAMAAPKAAAPGIGLARALPGLPAPAELAPAQPATAAALGIIYTTYWLRALAASSAPDPEQALRAATNDALAQIKDWLRQEEVGSGM